MELQYGETSVGLESATVYLYGRSRQTPIDNDNGLLDTVGRHAIGSVTIGQVVRAVVARLAHCIVPFHFEMVLARLGRFVRATFPLTRMNLIVSVVLVTVLGRTQNATQ